MNSLRRCLAGNTLVTRLFQEKRCVTSVRFLYNEQFLGLDKYKDARQRTISRLGNMRDNFYTRMRDQLNSSTPTLIFTEDLKTVIHSCEDSEDDIDICIRMMKRFHKQNKELRFGTFVFGPVAMRLFYFLQKNDLMQEFLTDPELEGFFHQLKSYYLTMDLCFKNEMYKEIIEAFKRVQELKLGETQFPREGLVLVTGASYKLNTEETFKFATELITQAREARVTVLRKCLAFVVALSLKQNQPNIGFEILSNIDRYNNSTATNLKLSCMARLGRFQDAFDVLRRVTDQDSPIQSRIRGTICQEVLDSLQEGIDKANDKETSHIFEQLCRSLKESNSITNDPMDNLICAPIEPRAFIRDDDMGSTFRPRGRFPDSTFRDRERSFGGGFGGRGGEEEFPRRRRFAGLSEEF